MASANHNADFQTAMDILSGPNVAREWRRAVALIESAADAGHADALERRAMLECKGIGRSVDWDKALDSLADGAEHGSVRAQRQLLVMAEDRLEETPSPGRSWQDIRASISIAERLRAPAGEVLSESPLIQSVSGFASATECAWLREAATPQLERALLYTNPPRPDPGRSNRFAVFRLANIDAIVEMIRTRLANAIQAPLPCLELSQVLHYGVGEQFSMHCDYLDPHTVGDEIRRNGQRAVTVLIYLNDDFEGGETSFPHLAINHRAKAGDALAFANVDPAGNPDPRTQHAGLPPSRGEKWVFSQWVRNRVPA